MAWPSSTVNDWLLAKTAPSEEGVRAFRKLVDYLEAKARRNKGEYIPLPPGRWNELIRDAQRHRQSQRRRRSPEGRSAGVRREAAAPVALTHLPALVTGFTGREDDLAKIAGMLDPAAEAGPVLVSAVAGLAGVGKTALAIHAAHAARKAGWFPGGVLFINLHGYDQVPPQAGQSLDALLRALDVADQHIPDGIEQRAGLHRSTLAKIGEPMLIFADNASSEEQVSPLLPGPGPHRVIVTSRHNLAGLSARMMDVAVLDDQAGVAMIATVLRVPA